MGDRAKKPVQVDNPGTGRSWEGILSADSDRAAPPSSSLPSDEGSSNLDVAPYHSGTSTVNYDVNAHRNTQRLADSVTRGTPAVPPKPDQVPVDHMYQNDPYKENSDAADDLYDLAPELRDFDIAQAELQATGGYGASSRSADSKNIVVAPDGLEKPNSLREDVYTGGNLPAPSPDPNPTPRPKPPQPPPRNRYRPAPQPDSQPPSQPAPQPVPQGNLGYRRTTEELHRPMVMNTGAIPKTNYSQKSTLPVHSPSPAPSAGPAAGPNDNKTDSNSAKPIQANDNMPPINNTHQFNANALALNEKEAMAKFRLHFQAGKLKERSGKNVEAISEFKKALEFEKIVRGEKSPEVAKTHGLIGRLYHKMGKNAEALDLLKKELQIYKNYGYTPETHANSFWGVHDVMAQVYDSLKNTAKEIENYEEAIRILVQSTSVPPERLPHMHNNVGNAYRTAGQLNKAKEHLETAKMMMELMHGDEPIEDMAKVHSSLGDVYNDLGLHQQAIDELEACIKIREKTRQGADGLLIRGGTHQTLATLYEAMGNTQMAAKHQEKSKSGLKGLMGSKEDRESLLNNLAGMVKGHTATGMLGKLAAGLTASEDINKAQQYQAENSNKLAIEHYEKGIESLNNLPDDIRNSEELLSTLALCHNNVGNAFRKTSQYQKAEEHLGKALKIRRDLYADEPSDDTASTLFNLGHLLQGIGGRVNTQRAIDMHGECLSMYLKLGGVELHKNWIVSLYRGLGVGYERLGNSRMSIENYEQAKAILTETNDLDELRAVCNNMGNSYESIGDFVKAEENINMALNMSAVLAVDDPSNTELQNHIAAGHNNLGVLYQTWGKFDKSLHHLFESKAIREKIKDVNMEAAHDVASSYHNIGNTLIKMGRFSEALENYETELRIRRDLGEDTSGVRVAMSNVCETMGDRKRAEELLEET